MADLLEQMRRNPAGNRRISDVERVCQRADVRCSPPRGGGSHYKVSDPAHADILTIPYRRPIKPVYIRALIAFIDAVQGGRTTD